MDGDCFPVPILLLFLDKAEEFVSTMQKMSREELKKCNDQIAALNYERLRSMDLRHSLSPAIFSYERIAFQYMAPEVFTYEEFDYLQENLRILSGLYGILRPSDCVQPYRLEMGAKLVVNGYKDLYGYWSDTLARSICAETDLTINLASKEYSLTIEKHLSPDVCYITVILGECIDGKIVERGALRKMAINKIMVVAFGQMVCYPINRASVASPDLYIIIKEGANWIHRLLRQSLRH